MNNERELLRMYCARGGYRAVLLDPFIQSGKVCASDGHMLIRIDIDKCEGKYPGSLGRPDGLVAPPIDRVVPEPTMAEPLTRRQLLKAVKKAPEEKTSRTCPDCGGEGQVEWRYTDKSGGHHHHLAECPVCDGAGEVGFYTAKQCQFILHGCALSLHHLKVLLRTMDLLATDTLTLAHCTPPAGAILLTAPDIEIVLMPQLRDRNLEQIEIV